MERKLLKHQSSSADDTMAFAKDFAATLKKGDVLRFEGDLGAGKTTFIKGLVQGLGAKDRNEVKSPTFVIMHIYQADVPVYHFDLYRLEGDVDMDSIGLEEFLGDPNAITCVEWADKAPHLFPSESYRIRIQSLSENQREIIIE